MCHKLHIRQTWLVSKAPPVVPKQPFLEASLDDESGEEIFSGSGSSLVPKSGKAWRWGCPSKGQPVMVRGHLGQRPLTAQLSGCSGSGTVTTELQEPPGSRLTLWKNQCPSCVCRLKYFIGDDPSPGDNTFYARACGRQPGPWWLQTQADIPSCRYG